MSGPLNRDLTRDRDSYRDTANQLAERVARAEQERDELRNRLEWSDAVRQAYQERCDPLVVENHALKGLLRVCKRLWVPADNALRDDIDKLLGSTEQPS